MASEVVLWTGAVVTGSDFLVDGGATASYYYGPLQPEKQE